MTNENKLLLNIAAYVMGTTDQRRVIAAIESGVLSPWLENQYMAIINGPFGEVEMTEQCECQAIIGYISAVDDMLQVIAHRRYPHRLDARAITLEREELSDALRGMRECFSSDSPQTLQ